MHMTVFCLESNGIYSKQYIKSGFALAESQNSNGFELPPPLKNCHLIRYSRGSLLCCLYLKFIIYILVGYLFIAYYL